LARCIENGLWGAEFTSRFTRGLESVNTKRESPELRKRNPNRVSSLLFLAIVSLGLMWIVFSTYAVPPLIKSAYRGESWPILNRMISGQASHPVQEYLSDWDRLRWRVLLDSSLVGLLIVFVTRPEFQRALWGPAAPHHTIPLLLEEEKRQRGAHFIALAVYLALAVILTLPTSFHPARALLGVGGDNYQHAWFLWAFAKAVVHGHNPFYTNLIFYPFGANLTWATLDPLGGMLALPLSLSLGPVLTYNISVILQLALAAFFARLLCLRVSQHAAAATIGGIVFGFSPFLLSRALGQISLVTAFPIPLYVLALDKILEAEKPSWKQGGLLGLALLLTALANPQYTVFCLMFTVVVLGIDFGLERVEFLKRVWMPLLVSAATFLVCFSPLLLMMIGSGLPKRRPIGDALVWSADLLGFFVPSPHHSFLGQCVRRMPAEYFAGGLEGPYTGFVALLLGAVGFWSARRKQRRWAGRAMVAGILFAALSLGPTVHFLGKPTDLPAPASLLYKVEFVRFLREPGRLAIITMLCLSLLATLGLVFLLNKFQRPWQKSLLLGIVGASLLLEYSTLPFPSSSIVDPARYTMLPKATQRCTLPPRIRDCTVLTVPLFATAPARPLGAATPEYSERNKSMWMQMMDGGRYHLFDGRAGPYVPTRVWAEYDQMPIVRFLRKMPTELVVPAPDREFADSLIRKLNLCAVVVFDAPERPLELNYVREVFSAKESMVGSCAVFEIAVEPKKSLSEPRRDNFPPRRYSRERILLSNRKSTAVVTLVVNQLQW
jgi:hypothetical protein